MERDFTQHQSYLKAKKKVKAIKGFYVHVIVYVLVNIFISGLIIYGLTRGSRSFHEALSNFGVYSTWLFWGIGIFFHWVGVFGFTSLISKDWETRKVKELMEKETDKLKRNF